jgi:hypothetical protein
MTMDQSGHFCIFKIVGVNCVKNTGQVTHHSISRRFLVSLTIAVEY